MVINYNFMAMTAHRALYNHTYKMYGIIEKLSTGQRINRAADDAAGLFISEKMRSQIRGLNQASRNAQDGISLIQIAEGALDQVHDMLQRVNELAVQAANDTYTPQDRKAIQMEINELVDEIDSVSKKTQFNGMGLLDGTFKDKKLQVGANAGDSMEISIDKMSAESIHLLPEGTQDVTIDGKVEQVKYKGINVMTGQTAQEGISIAQKAINRVSQQRGLLGAKHNRLEYKIRYLDNTAENLQAAESRIRDADMAKMMSEFMRLNVLSQFAQMVLAQANQLPQQVLMLLR